MAHNAQKRLDIAIEAYCKIGEFDVLSRVRYTLSRRGEFIRRCTVRFADFQYLLFVSVGFGD